MTWDIICLRQMYYQLKLLGVDVAIDPIGIEARKGTVDTIVNSNETDEDLTTEFAGNIC